MTKIYLYGDMNHNKTINENLLDMKMLMETNCIERGDFFSYKGKLYNCCVATGDLIFAKEFELKDIPDYDYQYSGEITCPYCGDQEGDSWEAYDEGERECGNCGGEFKYTREIDVSYCSEKLREPIIKNIT